MTGSPWEKIGPLEIAAAVLVLFILLLSTEILIALCRLRDWIYRRITGKEQTCIAIGTDVSYKEHRRRSSIPHVWSEVSVKTTSHSDVPDRIHTPQEELKRQAYLEGRIAGHLALHTYCHQATLGEKTEYYYQRRELGNTNLKRQEILSQNYRKEVRKQREEYRRKFTTTTQRQQFHKQVATYRRRSFNPEEERIREERRRRANLLRSGIFGLAQKTDLLIFSGEYTKAMDQDWHSGHFACWNCDKSLTGHRYILRDEHPFCIACYENLFANTCEECKQPIGTDSKDLSYKDKHWHENCFKCCDCQNSLVDQPFASKTEKLYCADCHDNNFAARCDGCGNIFRAGMKKFEFRGKQWHEQCFCCGVCKQPIGNKRFIPRDQEFVCVPCYEEQFAQRCAKCSGVINKGGITYKGTPFHRDCFTCANPNCNKILAGEKFTSRDEQPFCADCFGDLFAKKCCRCTKPITGLGGTKFISFDDRHWHSDCFGCYRCNNTLVGRGFLTNGDEILCPECGKNI